jgi:PAS domain S-box-containing protein
MSDQELTENHLRQSDQQFRLLVEQVADYAIFLLDSDGQVATWNAGAERIKGYTAQEIIGRPYATFFTEEDRDTCKPERLIEQARELGKVEDEGWRVRKDGSRFWADAVLTAVHDAEGHLRGFAKVTCDLTQRKQMEENLKSLLAREQAARAEAECGREQLQQFLGVVAHDLRSPLTSILASAQLLGRHEKSPEQLERTSALIANQAHRMNEIVSYLFDAAVIGVGEFKVHPQPMDLVATVRQIVEAQQMTTTRHHLLLEAPLSLEGRWDAERVEDALDNLIGNAIKYSPSGGEVYIRVELCDRQALVSVSDQGLGMLPEEIPQLFQLFSRLEPAGTIEGSGLGLYITRGFVEAHGGRIWAESAGPGQGSTFYLTLPLG